MLVLLLKAGRFQAV